MLVLLLTATTGAWAQTQWPSGSCTVTLNNGTLTVSGNGTMADYLNLSDRPWDGNSGDITSVVVESGVTSVGFNAFSSFSNLTSVTLPEGLTAIGPNAFNSCSSLQSITIPSTVTSISEGAFYGCSAMTSVTLPEGLTAIGGMTFSDCSSLTSVTIPSTVTSIEDAAFWNCSSLTSITIPSTVTSIGGYAFYSCSAISDVNLYANPDNLTWGDTSYDFKEGKATQCHVLAEYLTAYQTKFNGQVNVTFVGDLKPLTPPTYSVTLAEGTENADKWTVKVGEGEAQTFPVEGLEGGEKITATYSGTKKVKSVKAVKKAATIPVTAITLSKAATTISAGNTETLSVTAVAPDNATDKTYTWKTSDASIATVDQDGKVTAVALGTVIIYAEANDGSGVKGNCTVTVSKVVTINLSDWGERGQRSFTKDGVTVSAGMIDPVFGELGGDITISTTLGIFTKIVVTAEECYASGTGWSGDESTRTWAGTPASTVSFRGEFVGRDSNPTTIVCTIVP